MISYVFLLRLCGFMRQYWLKEVETVISLEKYIACNVNENMTYANPLCIYFSCIKKNEVIR